MTHTHTHTHTQATGAIAEQIKKDFGSYDEFKKQFET
jgi:superoxide dismutase